MTDTDNATLPKLLCERAKTTPDAQALREKSYGIWRAITWRGYRDRVEELCLGLRALGIGRGDIVAIVGDNRPEWVLSELAAQALGAIPLGIYQDSVSEELVVLAEASDAKLLIAEDQEQVDKVLEVRHRLPKLERVIASDPRGMRGYDDPCLMALSELAASGRASKKDDPGRFDALVAETSPDDVALLATTSGTTGTPKLAMLTHHNLVSMAKSLMAVDPLGPGDELVSFLPLAWVGEQMMSVSCALVTGATVNFPEEPETVTEDLREIAPHVMFSPPRIWESLLSEVQMKREDATWLKRRVLDWALDGNHSGVRKSLANLVCLYWIRDGLGLQRLKHAYTGGAALGPDTLRFFHELGVNLKQIYGQTEVSGISVVHRDGAVKPDTMGEPLPGTELRITEDGEIISRSQAVFAGYYKNDAGTAEVLRDGWLYSGDAGYLDADGQLVVIDRVDDVAHLEDGTAFSPQFVENKLKFSPYVREAVVFGGDGRPFVTALVSIDFQNVGNWAERRQVRFTTFVDLSQQEAVVELLTVEIRRVNEQLPEAMRVKRFLLLHKELDADDAELTRTRKVRRRTVAERYRGLVTALVEDASTVALETEIRYQDGRSAQISVSIPIVRL